MNGKTDPILFGEIWANSCFHVHGGKSTDAVASTLREVADELDSLDDHEIQDIEDVGADDILLSLRRAQEREGSADE